MEKMRIRICLWLGLGRFQYALDSQDARIQALEDELSQFKEALKARARGQVFDSDKIPDKPGRMMYQTVARRRAQAEAASQGPRNHDDKVRENNVRAIESAG